jgi:hypothetical protein
MRTVVFLGPSCPLVVAEAILNADYRPPARRGDILVACESGAKIVVLIDGVMIYEYPPSPKEIATAVASGTAVVGGASLGALRAVELRNHGVRGVGWVYARYLDGTVDADDEVVVKLDPRTGSPWSVPLIRIRYALECLREEGVITDEAAAIVIARLKEIHFEERTFEAVIELCKQEKLGDDLAPQLLDRRYDVKRMDTVASLQRAKEIAGAWTRA